jgi:asparagine synthase (glutamine-hydrolysing)
MCGFLVSSFESKNFRKGLNAARYRGPDNQSIKTYDAIWFGFNRLSIIDTSDRANQPLVENQRFVLVFNGEIYNYKELRKILSDSGETFSTTSDTEVLLKWLKTFGHKGLSCVKGMYSFVFYDRIEQTIFASRDRSGIKPLFLWNNGNDWALSSDLNSLYTLLGLTLDERAIGQFLQYRFLTSTSTFFNQVRQLEQGVSISIARKNNFKVTTFNPSANNSYQETRDYSMTGRPSDLFQQINEPMRIDYTETDPIPKNISVTSQVEHLLERAVKQQMCADVPVGFFLSGGIDSSLTVALARKVSGSKPLTYSVHFGEAKYSERPYQLMVARHVGTEHIEFESTADNFFTDFVHLCSAAPTPLQIPNYVTLYQLSKLAGDRVKVLLSGEGADEVFGGYHRFSALRMRRIIHALKIDWAVPHTMTRAKPLAYKSDYDLYVNSLKSLSDIEYAKFLNISAPLPPIKPPHQENIDLNFWLMTDQQFYMHGLLQRADMMTMMASIEARVPYLDDDLVQYVNNIKFNEKVGFRKRKKFIVEIAKKYLPPAIINRPKIGFHLPLENWFLSHPELRDLLHILIDDDTRHRGFFNVKNLEKILSNSSAIKTHAHSVLFPFLSLELWLRHKDRHNEGAEKSVI